MFQSLSKSINCGMNGARVLDGMVFFTMNTQAELSPR